MNLPFRPGETVMEIGGGANPSFRPNMDIRAMPTVDIVADLNKPFPLVDEGCENIYCSYCIEHISWRQVDGFIKEVLRITKSGGKVFFITANLLEQARMITQVPVLTDREVCAIFGDQNYGEADWHANSHYCGFSPQSAIEKFTAAGFEDVIVVPHPNCKTDMVIEATKPRKKSMDAAKWTPDERKKAYNREYFDGGKGKVGGYAHEGYWDYPIHWFTAQKILEQKPESVLEIGAARGYVLKKLEDAGVRCGGLEVSDHCMHTRVVDCIKQWDITVAPWPIADQSFDLAISMAVMEHIPEDKVKLITNEIQRTCKRAMHGISFQDDNDDFDKTHVTLRTKEWWDKILPPNHVVVDKEALEKGPPFLPPADNLVKLNVGSFTTMFHHGWINLDLHALQPWAHHYGYRFQQHDIRQALPYADNSVDLVYTCHCLEHLTYDEGLNFLNECRRVLKPDGLIRIIMPDAEKLISEYKDQKLSVYDELNEGCAKSEQQVGKLWALLFTGHFSTYDHDTILKTLIKAKFRMAKKCAFRQSTSKNMLVETIDMFPTLSLYVEALK